MTHRRTYMMCPSICNLTDLILGELNLVCRVGRTTNQVPARSHGFTSWFVDRSRGSLLVTPLCRCHPKTLMQPPAIYVWKAILAQNMFFFFKVQSIILQGFCSSHLHWMDWFASESQREAQNQTCSKLRHVSPTKYGFVWKCWVNLPNEIAI